MSVAPILIGGTGRSGTTILGKLLGANRACWVSPLELRFLTDPDGLVSLHGALVRDWSPYHADVALVRFAALMRSLKRAYVGRYPTTYLGRVFGPDAYDGAWRRFLAALEAFEYPGAWAGRTNVLEKALLRFAPGPKERYSRLIGRVHYARPLADEEFASLTAAFLDELLGGKLRSVGRTRFVEHTPGSFLHADLLLRFLPEMKLVHVVRDPRDVAASYRGQDWGPGRIEQTAMMLEDLFLRWEAVRGRLPPSAFVEIRFERLVAAPEAVLRDLCASLDLEFDPAMLSVDLSRHNIGRWKSQLSEGEVRAVLDRPGLARLVADLERGEAGDA